MTAPGFDRAQWQYDTADPPEWDDLADPEQDREDHALTLAERHADAESDPHWTPGDQP